MTLQQIQTVLGKENVNRGDGECYVAGKYFLIFNGTVLSKVVLNGSKVEYGIIIDNCTSAHVRGKNIAKY